MDVKIYINRSFFFLDFNLFSCKKVAQRAEEAILGLKIKLITPTLIAQ
jgi:hypothetical protein